MRAIAATAAGLLLVGCGLQTGTTGASKASSSPSGTQSAPLKPNVRCVHLKAGPGRVPGQRTVSLTSADNHGSFCVPRGTGVFVFLHESTHLPWTPIRSSSAVLEPRPNGALSLARGVTGAFFLAAQAGTAKLTSSEPRCFGGPHPGHRGQLGVRCPAPLEFAVTVHVLS